MFTKIFIFKSVIQKIILFLPQSEGIILLSEENFCFLQHN